MSIAAVITEANPLGAALLKLPIGLNTPYKHLFTEPYALRVIFDIFASRVFHPKFIDLRRSNPHFL